MSTKVKLLPVEQPLTQTHPNLMKSGDDMLRLKIEELRTQLHQLVQQKGMTDSSVIRLSQELDQYILLFQQMIAHPPKTPLLKQH